MACCFNFCSFFVSLMICAVCIFQLLIDSSSLENPLHCWSVFYLICHWFHQLPFHFSPVLNFWFRQSRLCPASWAPSRSGLLVDFWVKLLSSCLLPLVLLLSQPLHRFGLVGHCFDNSGLQADTDIDSQINAGITFLDVHDWNGQSPS